MNTAKHNNILILTGIMLVACCLRAPITGVGSLVAEIRGDLGLSHGMAGFVSTLPLIAFAVVSPFVSRMSSAFGAGRAMLASLLLLCVGIVMRSYTDFAWFYVGTFLIGVGIAFGNVLLPGIVKSAFARHAGVVTGVYVALLPLFSGIAAGVSVPLAQHGNAGWRGALAVWVIPALIAVVCWVPLRGLDIAERGERRGGGARRLLRSPVAWAVACYMGAQSFLFYSLTAWIPAILMAKGFSENVAGYYATIFQWVGIPFSLVLPMLAGRQKNQRTMSALVAMSFFAGIAVLMIGAGNAVLMAGIVMCGIGASASFGLAMSFMVLRADNGADAAGLSGMAQAFGFGFAAFSPMLLGRLYDVSGAWTLPLAFLLAIAALLFAVGFKAAAGKINA